MWKNDFYQNANEILLRRKMMIFLPETEKQKENNDAYVASFISNLCSYGVMVNKDLYEKLLMLSRKDLIFVYKNIFPLVKKWWVQIRNTDVCIQVFPKKL